MMVICNHNKAGRYISDVILFIYNHSESGSIVPLGTLQKPLERGCTTLFHAPNCLSSLYFSFNLLFGLFQAQRSRKKRFGHAGRLLIKYNLFNPNAKAQGNTRVCRYAVEKLKTIQVPEPKTDGVTEQRFLRSTAECAKCHILSYD